MKRLQRLAKVTDYVYRFRVPSCPDITPIITVNQENATSQLARSSGDQLLIALPEGRCSGADTDGCDESVSFAIFVLSKVNGPARTNESAQVAYGRLLGILDACLERLTDDLIGEETGAPCPQLTGLDLTMVDVVPEYSVFGGWSGYYAEIVLE
ncbi:MAG: hypothetical protein IJG35_04370 [Bacteroidales bacterium]|nr:hypothetical protein [Bacteroidales bacterium]